MQDRFTPRVRAAMYRARDAAKSLGHGYVGTEHLLLGILGEPDSIGALALRASGLQFDAVRSAVETLVDATDDEIRGEIPFTPRSKRVLELSVEEARTNGHNYVGTGHLLVALSREGEGLAAHALGQLGVDTATLRSAFLKLESETSKAVATPPPTEDEDRSQGAAEAGLTLLVDPGTASPEEIGELLSAISELYRQLGGSGITFRHTEIKSAATST